jgi:4-hydroxy-3-polyprenylbenzoate decarboxylase
LGLPRLTPQAPWFGYDLGDWAELWQHFADNAVAGKWAENGKETWPRRKPDLIPETPVRKVETVK